MTNEAANSCFSEDYEAGGNQRQDINLGLQFFKSTLIYTFFTYLMDFVNFDIYEIYLLTK